MMDSDYVVSCLFFIFGIIILAFWLLNLVIAVVTTSFQVIREENNQSAFASLQLQKDKPSLRPMIPQNVTKLQRLYSHSKLIWIALITFDLIVQA